MKRRLLAAIFLFASLATAPAAETPSELKPFVRGSWQEMLRSHAGRPTLVHFWGVTCGPCKIELPLLGQFNKWRVRAVTGLSPSRFIQKIRLNAALRLIESTRMPLAEVAARVGL